MVKRSSRLLWGCVLLAQLLSAPASAQDLEPRRWAQLPTGMNVIGVGTSITGGEVLFDPVLQLEDVTFDLYGAGFAYLRSFGLFGRSARVDVLLPYAMGRWEGLLEGEPASTRRHGLADPRIRLSVLLYGGPAENPEEFAVSEKSNTVIGAAVSVRVPVGQYYDDRLINLGKNRWVVRPQLGITHTRGRWTGELTGSVFLFTDNDRFYQESLLENDPLWAIQAHLIFTFKPGLWVSASTAFGDGADAEINGVSRGARTEKWLQSLAVSLPIDRSQGLKLAWLRDRTQYVTGSDSDTFIVGWSKAFY